MCHYSGVAGFPTTPITNCCEHKRCFVNSRSRFTPKPETEFWWIGPFQTKCGSDPSEPVGLINPISKSVPDFPLLFFDGLNLIIIRKQSEFSLLVKRHKKGERLATRYNHHETIDDSAPLPCRGF